MPSPRILVVNDNPGVADYLLVFLEMWKFRTAVAYDGLTGLVLAKVTKPDLVLLNVSMPIMNGFQVLKELRENQETANMKVVMVTAWRHLHERTMKEGAQGYICIPFKRDYFAKTLERVLGWPV